MGDDQRPTEGDSRRWPQSQEGDYERPHLCKLADTGLDLSENDSSESMYDEGDRNLAVG